MKISSTRNHGVESEVSRREVLRTMGSMGAGMLFAMIGGVPKIFDLGASFLGSEPEPELELAMREASFSFAHVSDSHIGFNLEPNKNVLQTFSAAVAKINHSDSKVDFVIHTGDLTHNSRQDEFDAAEQVMKTAKVGSRFYVPGERDLLDPGAKAFRSRFCPDSKGDGWYSFNHKGVHFVALVNVMNYRPGQPGSLGAEQLRWLESDLAGILSSTPLVVFTHIPLYNMYSEWGWCTSDGAAAIGLFKKFGSVTVLNGHVHMSMQKLEGTVLYHSSMSTAYPFTPLGTTKLPEPGSVPASNLRDRLGVSSIQKFAKDDRLSIIDSTLSVLE